MSTFLGKYLKTLKVSQSTIADRTDIKLSRLSDLCNDFQSKIYSEEFFKIIFIAHNIANLEECQFKTAIEEVFPYREKIDLLDEYKNLSIEARFFKKYTLPQNEIENKLGIANGKLSKYFSDITKRALAVEIIMFSEGLELDPLLVFKDLYADLIPTLKQ
ncbi:hypothetical protein PZ892_16565 [Sphingobacterium sp. WM]|uniref:hypothetical protein n=1 Tax=Sphingobacterium sp. WM TaxID=3031802 RepID=UPI00240D6C0D|nr:hypothetical protein [Sphingobacterium sp. WM]WFB63273.1 hypothetical protein PZ892_16565 [Sphingobacterium sp. WM]